MAVMTVRVAGDAGQVNVVALLQDRFVRQGLDVALVWQRRMVVRREVTGVHAPEACVMRLDTWPCDGCQVLDTRHDLLLLLPPPGPDEALLLGVSAAAGIPILGVAGIAGLDDAPCWASHPVCRPVTAWAVDAVAAAEMVERICGCLVARQHRDDACGTCACAPVCGVGR